MNQFLSTIIDDENIKSEIRAHYHALVKEVLLHPEDKVKTLLIKNEVLKRIARNKDFTRDATLADELKKSAVRKVNYNNMGLILRATKLKFFRLLEIEATGVAVTFSPELFDNLMQLTMNDNGLKLTAQILRMSVDEVEQAMRELAFILQPCFKLE